MSSVAHVRVTINGAMVGGTVETVDVEDHDRLIDRATIVIDDPKHAYADSALENQPVSIELGWEDEKALVFVGITTKVDVQSLGGSRQRLTLTAYDPAYLLNLRHPPETARHEGTLSEIVKKIVSRPAQPKIEPAIVLDDQNIKPVPNPTLDITQPPNVRDWDFIVRLAIDHGCRTFVEVNDGKAQLYFVSEKALVAGDPMGVLHFCNGFNQVLDFSYRRVASGASPVSTTAIDGPTPGEVLTATSDPAQPTAAAKASPETRANLGQTGGSTAAYDQALLNAKQQALAPEEQIPKRVVAGAPSDAAKAERDIKRDPTRLIGLFGEGTAVGTTKLRAKGKVTIKGISPWAEGDWYVARVNHIYTRVVSGKQDRSTYRTKFAVTR